MLSLIFPGRTTLGECVPHFLAANAFETILSDTRRPVILVFASGMSMAIRSTD